MFVYIYIEYISIDVSILSGDISIENIDDIYIEIYNI